MGFFSRSDDAAAWPRVVSSGDGPPPEALGGFRSSAGVVDGQLDVQNIVRGQVGSELQLTCEVGRSSRSHACCHTGLVYGNICGLKAQN